VTHPSQSAMLAMADLLRSIAATCPEWSYEATHLREAADMLAALATDMPTEHLADLVSAITDENRHDEVGLAASFSYPRVQVVYEILCDLTPPPDGEHWEGFAATRIVAALAQPALLSVPAGWKLAPTEPTDQQLLAAHEPHCEQDRITISDLRLAYRAMIAAAPNRSEGTKLDVPAYYPAVIEFPDSNRVEFVLRDCATIYEPGELYDTIRDMETREVIGFAWTMGTNPQTPNRSEDRDAPEGMPSGGQSL